MERVCKLVVVTGHGGAGVVCVTEYSCGTVAES